MNYKKAIFKRAIFLGVFAAGQLFSAGYVLGSQQAVEGKQTLLDKAYAIQMRTAIQHADLKSIDPEIFNKLPYEVKLEFLATLQKKIEKLDPENSSFYIPVFWKLLVMEMKAFIMLYIKHWVYPEGVQALDFHEISSFGEYGLYLVLAFLLIPDFSEFMALMSKRAEIYNYENYDVRASWIKDYENCLAIRELLKKASPDLFLQIQES